MAEINEKNYPLFIDDSELCYSKICEKKYNRTLESDLKLIQFVNTHNNLKFKQNSRVAKLEREMLKYGLEVTPDMNKDDIKRLAMTIKSLNIV